MRPNYTKKKKKDRKPKKKNSKHKERTKLKGDTRFSQRGVKEHTTIHREHESVANVSKSI